MSEQGREGSATVRVAVDWDRCSGIGMCEATAPDLFEVDDDGQLQLLLGEDAEVDATVLEGAVVACPTAALRAVRP